MHEHVTLLPPEARDPRGLATSAGLPADLLSESAGRLRTLALLYAFVFLMANVVPALVFEPTRFLGNVLAWAPSAIGICSFSLMK